MKEAHQDKLAELLIGYTEKASETTGTIVEWLQIQAPELCSEIIMYNMVYNGSLVVGSLFFVLLIVPCIFVARYIINNDTIDDGFTALPISTGILCVIISPALLCSGIPALLKCYFAPKLFLLEYMKGFM